MICAIQGRQYPGRAIDFLKVGKIVSLALRYMRPRRCTHWFVSGPPRNIMGLARGG